MDPLTSAALAVFVCALAAFATGRIRLYQYHGLFSIAEGLFSIAGIRSGAHFGAVLAAALSALFAYWWWIGGGGVALAAV